MELVVDYLDHDEWGHDGADPSVGIFGDAFWHENCDQSEIGEGADIVNYIHHWFEGSGFSREIWFVQTIACFDCGKVEHFLDAEWYGPEDDDES